MKSNENKKHTYPNDEVEQGNGQREKLKCIDLHFLTRLTKSDPKLMMEMISLYLQQTPPLVNAMKQSVKDKDWNSLYVAVHKMIPSFSIMGISADSENMAKKIQDYTRLNAKAGQANTTEQIEEIPSLVLQLENICTQACKELEDEFNKIKNKN